MYDNPEYIEDRDAFPSDIEPQMDDMKTSMYDNQEYHEDSDAFPTNIEPQMDDMKTSMYDTQEYHEDSDAFPSDIEQMIDGTKETRDDDPLLINYIKHQMKLPALVDKQLNLSSAIHTGQVFLILQINTFSSC